MSKFSLNTIALKRSIDESVQITSNILVAKVREITPRDKDRLPKNNIDRLDGETPERSSHYKPVQIEWHWYEWVTWNLKRSIWMQKIWEWRYVVWVNQWYTEEYWRVLEFWTDDIEKRSFLRQWLEDNEKELTYMLKSNFTKLLKKYWW